MNSEEIKEYVEQQLARAERMIPSERSGLWHDRQCQLMELWLKADQAQVQEKRIEQADSANALLLRIAIAIEMLESQK